MQILAIDPGQTCGIVVLECGEGPPYLVGWDQQPFSSVGVYASHLAELLRTWRELKTVVIEDYRVYQGMEGAHVGKRLFEAELIGATRAVAVLESRSVVAVPASWKGKWPRARLDAKYPDHKHLVSLIHAHDALRIGLAYITKEGIWTP